MKRKKEEVFSDLYCKTFKEMCNICQPRCEDGDLDCVKCDRSIQTNYKEN